MSCSSLLALARECGADGNVGGLEKVYMIAFNDLKPVAGSLTNEVYTISTGGLVSEIGVVTAKEFVEVGLLRSTAGLNSEMTKEASTATRYFTDTFTLVIGGMGTDQATFVNSVLDQPVVVITKSRTGKFFTAGLNGQLELSALTGGTGTAEGDLQGYTLTFTGISTKLPLQVDPTIIAGLLEPAV